MLTGPLPGPARTLRLASAAALCLCIKVCLGAGVAGAASPEAVRWAAVVSPTGGRPDVIGGYANGCISGAVPLPPEGAGYQGVRLGRNRFYGHPDLIGYVTRLGRQVAAEGLGTLAVGDLSQPRGGPLPYGHASHQIGLDADIWFRLDLPPLPRDAREAVREVEMVASGDRRMLEDRWGDRQARMVRLAAADRSVARIFVAPAVKLALCEMRWPDRGWLRTIRPWFGHTDHLHVRLHCPADSPDCRPQDEAPEGDGCGAELMSWFAPPAPRPSSPPAVRPARPPLPDACRAVLAAPDSSTRPGLP